MLINILYTLPGTGADADYGDRQETDLAIVSFHVRRHGFGIKNLGCCTAGSSQTAQANAIGFVRTAPSAERIFLGLSKVNAGSYLTQINYRDSFLKALIYKGLVGALDRN